jgi:tRNA (5-methylaminomethyl-2-thiouridylate)-methyltransferase
MFLARRAVRAVQRRCRSTVAVGMSGGVDSSVAALLLKQQGHEVVGVHMTNWDSIEDGLGHDCSERDRKDAEQVCRRLGIGFHEVSFQREYWHEVFTPFLQGYRDGGTPNPDLSCNRHIKFGHFAEHARRLGADRVATGHYARLRRSDDGLVELLSAVDETKDQSYFLAAVRQEPLQRALFPLGELRKEQVRRLAVEAGLHTADKKDSVGICFVGKRDFGEFIESYLPQVSSGPPPAPPPPPHPYPHEHHLLHSPHHQRLLRRRRLLPQTPGDFVCVESGEKAGREVGGRGAPQ